MIKKINTVLVAILLIAQQGMAQKWVVPDNQKGIKNPSTYNLENVKKGKNTYNKNCKSCHGDPGKNNGLPLVPPPPDMTSATMQANTEGELFYKITKGRGGMPQFESTLSKDDRWRLINYIMNYNSAYEPVLVEAAPKKAKLMASVNEVENKVEIFAEVENKNGEYLALNDATVSIGAKKAFGNIPIGKVVTNKEGRAEYTIPKDLIGDEQGLVNVVVHLDEEYIVDPVVLDAAKVGQMKQVPKLIQKEVLWSTNENVQTWLLLSYIGAVGAAWLTIAYVILQIIKIWRAGRKEV